MKWWLFILSVLGAHGASFPHAFWGEWVPPQGENLVFWCKADTVLTNSNVVLTWNDSWTNHFDLTTGGGPTAPWFSNAFPPAIKFVQGRFFTVPTLALTGILAHSAAEVFMVIKANADPASSGLFNWMYNWAVDTPQGQGNMAFPYSDGNIYDSFFGNGRRPGIDPTPSLANNFRLYNVMSAQSGSWVQRLDTSVLQSDNTNVFGIRTPGEAFFLGQATTVAGGAYSDGFIQEILLYRTNVTDQSKQYIQNHLRSKWRLKGY